MATRVLRQTASAEPSEANIVNHLAKAFDTYPREAVVNYYVALKTTRFVILVGPAEADKEALAQGLAKALVGQPSLQWSPIRAHPWWATETRSPRQMAEAHARFNSLKLHDFIEAASTSEMLGLPFSFFAGISQMSPAEVVCYFEDLPCGLFWQADGSTIRIHLPTNLFITGTMDAEEDEKPLLGSHVRRHAITIRLNADQCPPAADQPQPSKARLDWQQAFIAPGTRRDDLAQAKLTRILPEGCASLGPLDDLTRLLGTPHIPSSVCAQARLYLANAFDRHGRGLFVEPADENLAIAQDYVMAQSVIPSMRSRWSGTPRMEETVGDYLEAHLPRSYSRWRNPMLAD